MSMEILFRGKRTSNGKWVYGDLFHGKDGMYIQYWENGQYRSYEVDPSTVGQYTALTDKNCVRIFSGDIVLISKDGELQLEGVVVYGNGSFEVRALMDEDGMCLCLAHSNDMEVRVEGNIYDNPDLLSD